MRKQIALVFAIIILALTGIGLCLYIMTTASSVTGCLAGNCQPPIVIAGVSSVGLGLGFYMSLVALASLRAWRLALVVTAIAVSVSLSLIGVQAATGAWCYLCLSSAAVNLSLVLLCYIAYKTGKSDPLTQPLPIIILLLIGLSGPIFDRIIRYDPVIIQIGRDAYRLSYVDQQLSQSMQALEKQKNDLRRGWGYDQALLKEAAATDQEVAALIQAALPAQPTIADIRAYQDYLADTHDLSFQLPTVRDRVEIPAPGYSFVRLGEATAPLKITMFSDIQCPFCKTEYQALRQLYNERTDIQLEFRHFPLSRHEYALPLAIGSICAGQQGQFWSFLDDAFNAPVLSDSTIREATRALDLDREAFETCLADPDTASYVQSDRALGESLGVSHTPTTFINGIYHDGPVTNMTLNQYL